MELVNVNAVRKIVVRDWQQADYIYKSYRKPKGGFLGSRERKEGYYSIYDFDELYPDFKVGDNELPEHLVEKDYKLWVKPYFCIIYGNKDKKYYYFNDWREALAAAEEFIEKHGLNTFRIDGYDEI